jgi:prepilin-type N-terminal cleavage/methylation domain-containing protein/prepilin-type processing-associated H-X9-DG protein
MRKGFTLVELLVVIAIIGILVALLLPAVQAAREAGRRSSCQNNLKQLGIALHNHHDILKYLPPGGQDDVLPVPANGGGVVNGTTWLIFILPYAEQENIYKQYNQQVAYDNATNKAVGNIQVPIYYCPSGSQQRSGNSSESSGGIQNLSTHYYGIMGPTGTAIINNATVTYTTNSAGSNSAWSTHGILGYFHETAAPLKVRIADINDGTSTTLMVAERSNTEITGNSYRSWTRGCNGGCGATKNVTNPINSTNYNGSNNFNDISFGSNHPGGANFGLGDGSVRFISQTINMNVYKGISSRFMNEAVQPPE